MANDLELVELDDRARAFLKLEVDESQIGLVATMAENFADALFPPDDGWGAERPWMRGVLRDGEPAGFIMCSDPTDTQADAWIWRLLVDKRHQRSGVGIFAVTAALQRYQAMNVERVLVSWHPREGDASAFYRKLGFQETGEMLDGEVVAAMSFN